MTQPEQDAAIEGRLLEIDRKLAEGWRPTGRPVDEVVTDLQMMNPHLLRPDLLNDPRFLENVEKAREFFEQEGVASAAEATTGEVEDREKAHCDVCGDAFFNHSREALIQCLMQVAAT